MKQFIISKIAPKITAAKIAIINNELFKAAYQGDLEKVNRLLDEGADINYIQDGKSALICAILRNKENIVKHLLNRGASAQGNAVSNEHGGIDPAITVAAMKGNGKIDA